MSIERNVDGIVDFCFDKLEELDRRDDVEIEKKMKLTDMLLKNVWKGATVILEQKKLMMKSPDLAGNEKVNVKLGRKSKTKRIKAVEADRKTAEGE